MPSRDAVRFWMTASGLMLGACAALLILSGSGWAAPVTTLALILIVLAHG